MENHNLTEMLSLIDIFNERILHNQALNVDLQEQLKNLEQDIEKTLNRYCLGIIEILDFIYRVKNSLEVNLEVVIEHILKKLNLFLEELEVKEIILANDKLDSRLTRVIATKEASANIEIGSIIEVCRRGYIRSGRVIRPVDVITAK